MGYRSVNDRLVRGRPYNGIGVIETIFDISK
jgi:hypothetical protein